jgi:hypothetical protein
MIDLRSISITLGLARVAPEKLECLTACQPHFQTRSKERHMNTEDLRSTRRSWASMKSRCLNPNHHAYNRYGGAGIKITPEWLGINGFQCFLRDMGPRPEGKTLDRKDCLGGYNKDNCRWATWLEQGCNRSNNNRFLYRGESKTVSEWARSFKLKHHTLSRRLRVQGLSIEEALNRPLLRILK